MHGFTEIETASVDETQAALKEFGLIQELNERLDAGLWPYDQYIAGAGENSELREFWLELKDQDQETVKQLKQLLADHFKNDEF